MTVEYLTSEGKVLTRKVAWLSYVASMLATRMVDGIVLYQKGALPGTYLVGSALLAWFLIGVAAYGMDRPLGRPALWSVATAVAYIASILGVFRLGMMAGWEGAAPAMHIAIAHAPMLYALWAYQRDEHPRWMRTSNPDRTNPLHRSAR